VRNLDQLLAASAHGEPQALAIVDGKRTISYGELNERAARLAGLLVDLGVRRGDRVAIYLEKSIEAIVAIYGVLRAGGCYVPFDPLAPPARLGNIAGDADIRVLLTGAEKAGRWPSLVAEGAPVEALIVLNGDDGIQAPPGMRLLTTRDVARAGSAVRPRGRTEHDLAYILYTSGSTGTPKGVMLSHRNCLAFVEWVVEKFSIAADDRLSSHAPLHFDLSTFDLFAAALAGAPVVLVPPETSVFPAALRRFIEVNEITVWYSVPSILSMLALRGGLSRGDLACLRCVLFAGEVFPTRYLRLLMELLSHARFVNLYGPTETNVCTWYDVPVLPEEMTEPIPIGKAIAGVEAFAVTEEGRSAALEEVGELYVRGPTVMQGYWGDPERTSQVLVPDPRDGVSPETVYRTGDLVQKMEDGNFRFLGRRDSQVKSHGYRIELGDVEAALYAHEAVIECAAVPIPDDLMTNRIKAYVATRQTVSKANLISFCADRIPRYMIPELFEFRDVLPKTSTGKVDRQALAADATRCLVSG
jgi:amino acid adenylation domain-containing protein